MRIMTDPPQHSQHPQPERGHGPIIVLVMARIRQNGESSLINSVISDEGGTPYTFTCGRDVKDRAGRTTGYIYSVQGYLAHKKTPNPLGPPLDPRHRPVDGKVLGGGGSYERGTPVGHAAEHATPSRASRSFPDTVQRLGSRSRRCQFRGSTRNPSRAPRVPKSPSCRGTSLSPRGPTPCTIWNTRTQS